MIQRFSVHFEDSANLDAVLQGLKSLGFAENAIRVWSETNSQWTNVHAYRDGDVDTMKPPDPKNMEEYCVQIWSRIGYARIILTEFGNPINVVEFANDEFFNWESG